MEQSRIIIVLTGKPNQQLRELAEKECLPMTTLAKQIVLKYLASQQPKDNVE